METLLVGPFHRLLLLDDPIAEYTDALDIQLDDIPWREEALHLQAAATPEREVAVPPSLVESCPALREVPGLRLATDEELFALSEPPSSDAGQLEMF